jgi:mannosyl-glycoprotein endo-beta-N-acetylglucosaminidase
MSHRLLFLEGKRTLLYATKMEPIESIEQLMAWKPGFDSLNEASVRLDRVDARWWQQRKAGRVFHCHDMMGGYTGDECAQGNNDVGLARVYNFSRWNQIDALCYFGHARLTLPPRGWIDAAHRHGVHCLATLITEWEDGERDNEALLRTDAGGARFLVADQLVAAARAYGFDGYLVNIEAKLASPAAAALMERFVRYLRGALHEALPGSLVVWYDSVSRRSGAVRHYNALSDDNAAFLDVADAILLNYQWTPSLLDASLAVADAMGRQRRDILVGVDVFGRGSYGGGGFSIGTALSEIDARGLSLGLFAPAWTLEQAQRAADFELRERRLWARGGAGASPQLHTFSVPRVAFSVTRSGGDGFADERHDVGGSGQAVACRVASFDVCEERALVELAVALPDVDWQQQCSGLPPLIVVEERYSGTPPNCADPYFVGAALLDANRQVLASERFVDSASSDWQTARLELSCSAARLPRYVRIDHGGRDAEQWRGHYGVRIADTRLCVVASVASRHGGTSSSSSSSPSLPSSIGDFFAPRAYRIDALPLRSNFSSGVGAARYVGGKCVSTRRWTDMSAQSLQLSMLDRLAAPPSGFHSTVAWRWLDSDNGDGSLQPLDERLRFSVALDDSIAFDGGSSLAVRVLSEQQQQCVSIVAVPLFDFEAPGVRIGDSDAPCATMHARGGAIALLLFVGRSRRSSDAAADSSVACLMPASLRPARALCSAMLVAKFGALPQLVYSDTELSAPTEHGRWVSSLFAANSIGSALRAGAAIRHIDALMFVMPSSESPATTFRLGGFSIAKAHESIRVPHTRHDVCDLSSVTANRRLVRSVLAWQQRPHHHASSFDVYLQSKWIARVHTPIYVSDAHIGDDSFTVMCSSF